MTYGEDLSAKLQKFLRNLVGKGDGRAFVAVLTVPGDETVLCSSYGNSRDTAAALRAAADRLDGGKN